MRAVALEAPGVARVVRAPAPEPSPRQVLVRLEGCGVCGSNLPLWEGRHWFEYPLPAGAPGHEGWGRIEALGGEVDGSAPGTRVAFLGAHGFAELDVADADTVVPLPPELDDLPFPAEAIGCAFNVLRRSGIGRGDRVAVVGVGFLGALVVSLAVGAGAVVTAVSRRPFALELARSLGARQAVRAEELDEGEFDCVVEVAGVQETLDVATRLTRVHGRLVVAGYHQERRTVDMQLWNWRGLDVVNAHERDPKLYVEGMRAAVAAVVSGALDIRRLITHVFPLECASDAFEAARTRPDGFLKAVIVP
jgi:2-desacetyl-2-hydroxyethyl bacteriochlorophyllide A dehydrogenase